MKIMLYFYVELSELENNPCKNFIYKTKFNQDQIVWKLQNGMSVTL